MHKTEAFTELERGVIAALETYSNVHRGSGHNSMVSTHLFEQARDIVLDYLGLSKDKYIVIFCTPRRAETLKANLKQDSYQNVSSNDIRLSLGIKALAVKRKALPKDAPSLTGGGTTRLISPQWVIWAKAPDKFEAGTPAIINVIAFARALQLIRQSGDEVFPDPTAEKHSVNEILYHDELEQIKSSGEENPGGIAALGKALVIVERIGLDLIREEEQALTRRILRGLSQIKGLKIYGVNDPASPRFALKGGVIAYTLRGFMSDKVAKELAVRGGIGVRYGCHCAHILVKHILGVPPPLERFQRIIASLFPRLRFPGVARVSLGIENTEEDVDNFINVMGKIAAKTNTLKQKEAERQINDFINAAAVKVYSQL